MDKNKLVKTLDAIVEDMKNDAAELDGKPFNGITTATHFGYLGAAIASLAGILKEMIQAGGTEEKPIIDDWNI